MLNKPPFSNRAKYKSKDPYQLIHTSTTSAVSVALGRFLLSLVEDDILWSLGSFNLLLGMMQDSPRMVSCFQTFGIFSNFNLGTISHKFLTFLPVPPIFTDYQFRILRRLFVNITRTQSKIWFWAFTRNTCAGVRLWWQSIRLSFERWGGGAPRDLSRS